MTLQRHVEILLQGVHEYSPDEVANVLSELEVMSLTMNPSCRVFVKYV